LNAIGPAAHRRFCEIDGWDNPDGTNHDEREKHLADRRLLRTTSPATTERTGRA
jgi:hypothetical protein